MDDLGVNLNYLREQTEGSTAAEEYKKAIAEWDTLNQTAKKTEFVQSFIAKRKNQLVREAMQYAGNMRAIKKLNKETWYYAESIRNYRELFEDAGKRERLAKKLLSGIPAYQQFARENSVLASLFAIPAAGGDPNNAASLAGLQTRAGVQDMIQQRISAGGPNGMAQVRQNLQEAQGRLSEIKDKILKGSHIGPDGDVEMPDFKPNGQRSKTFLQRIQYGFDIQFARNSNLMPSTAVLGLNIGYRLNDNGTVGAGISYKLGMGSIEHIRLSSEGAGLRSYLDWKIKGRWYVAGGYEMNYRSRFKDMDDLSIAPWQRSGLAGISRQYKAGKKMKGEVKLMYDFLYNTHIPKSAPLMMRVGYNW